MYSRSSKNGVLALLAVVFLLANIAQSWGNYEHKATDDCAEVITDGIDAESESSTDTIRHVGITVKPKEAEADDTTNTAEESRSVFIKDRPYHKWHINHHHRHRCHFELPTL